MGYSLPIPIPPSADGCGGPVGGVPLGHGDEVALGVGERAGGWIEASLVRLASANSGGHGVVGLADAVFGVEFAAFLLVLGFDNGERRHVNAWRHAFIL